MSEVDPSQNPPSSWELLLRAITKAYEIKFAKAPARAAAARQAAAEAVAVTVTGLEEFGFPLDALRAGIAERGDDFRRVLGWAAFNYSVERPGGSVQTADPEVMAALPAYALHTHEADFGAAFSFTQQTVIAMHLYRQEAAQGPITDPSQNFADDFATVVELKFPSQPS